MPEIWENRHAGEDAAASLYLTDGQNKLAIPQLEKCENQ